MSLAEDIEHLASTYDDEFFEEKDDSIFKDYILGRLFWKTKDLQKINIQSMTESHIKNCIRIPLYKNKVNWDIIFNYELNKRNND